MMTYISINYRFIVNKELIRQQIREVLGILLATLLICGIIHEQRIERPEKEEAVSFVATRIGIPESSAVGSSDFSGKLACRGIGQSVLTTAGTEELLKSTAAPEILETEKIFESEEIRIPTVLEEVIPDIPFGDIAVPGDGEIIPEEDGSDAGAEEEFSDTGVQNPDISVPSDLDGFLVNEAGMIIGCDNVLVTDGVLEISSDEMCVGIAAGALSSLGDRIHEIYIPANIVNLELGAFDGLSELFYIEVMPGNPNYMSINGVLCNVDGSVADAAPFVR